MQSNKERPFLTVKLSGKTKPGNKKYETYQFRTRNCPLIFSNARHHMKFRKNLMNRFCEIFIFLHFLAKNVSFLKNKKKLLPFFNACHQVQFPKKCNNYLILSIKRIFLKCKNSHFYPLINTYYQVNFQK